MKRESGAAWTLGLCFLSLGRSVCWLGDHLLPGAASALDSMSVLPWEGMRLQWNWELLLLPAEGKRLSIPLLLSRSGAVDAGLPLCPSSAHPCGCARREPCVPACRSGRPRPSPRVLEGRWIALSLPAQTWKQKQRSELCSWRALSHSGLKLNWWSYRIRYF